MCSFSLIRTLWIGIRDVVFVSTKIRRYSQKWSWWECLVMVLTKIARIKLQYESDQKDYDKAEKPTTLVTSRIKYRNMGVSINGGTPKSSRSIASSLTKTIQLLPPVMETSMYQQKRCPTQDPSPVVWVILGWIPRYECFLFFQSVQDWEWLLVIGWFIPHLTMYIYIFIYIYIYTQIHQNSSFWQLQVLWRHWHWQSWHLWRIRGTISQLDLLWWIFDYVCESLMIFWHFPKATFWLTLMIFDESHLQVEPRVKSSEGFSINWPRKIEGKSNSIVGIWWRYHGINEKHYFTGYCLMKKATGKVWKESNITLQWYIFWLVVWLPFFISPHIGLLIIPTDFHIFQRGGPTTNQ